MIIEDGVLPQRIMPVFMLIDTSESMVADKKIDKVNRAVEETIQQLRDISDNNLDAEIHIAIMDFSTEPKWVTPGAVTPDEVIWSGLTAGGQANMGAAFEELESKLYRSQFIRNSNGYYAPMLILLSDGVATDNINDGLNKLRKNNWYRVATRVAIAVGNAAMDTLVKFTGSDETVIHYDNNRQNLQELLTLLMWFPSSGPKHSRNTNALGSIADSDSVVDVDSAIQAMDATPQVQQETGNSVDWLPGW